MSKKNIDVGLLCVAFQAVYEELYSGASCRRYNDLVAAGDRFIENNPEIVGEFNRRRGDLLTSDREVAAFMIAIEAIV